MKTLKSRVNFYTCNMCYRDQHCQEKQKVILIKKSKESLAWYFHTISHKTNTTAMKKTKAIMMSPVLLLLALLWVEPELFISPQETNNSPAAEVTSPDTENHAATKAITAPSVATPITGNNSDSIVSYAMGLLGSPYIYAGITPEGFDCSGFVTHVFDQFGMDVPHSSAMQAEEGIPVKRADAQTGDLVIFTGTDPELREPGHVGIVISSPGDTIEFVHSSSNGGVKVSQVEGTGYEVRFLQIRRIL